jgi:hypothetical protein
MQHLGAHHSPDIFHVQQEINRGTSAAMASKVRAILQEVDALETELANRKVAKQEMRGRPSTLSLKTDQEISGEMVHRKVRLTLLQEQQAAIREAKNGIAAAYHPYDLKSGAARPTEQVQSELEQYFETIKIQATATELLVQNQLIPIYYLAISSRKAKTA